MVQPDAAGHPVPANFIPPEGLMEYISLLVQNGTFPVPPASPSPVPPSIPPPAQGRAFTRAGCGTGGELVEKQKVSKQITAPANKRKTLVDPDIETQPAVAENTDIRQAKRPKTVKVSRPL